MTLFLDVIVPILFVVAIGALAHRRFELNIQTLSRLTIYVFVPAFLFVNVYETALSWSEIGGILAIIAVTMLVVGTPFVLALRRARIPAATIGAMLLGGVVYNAGNVGVPVADFFYSTQGAPFPGMSRAADGKAVQALVLMAANLSIWVVGFGVLATAKGQGLRGVVGFFRLPMLYVVALGFGLRDAEIELPKAILEPIRILGDAVVPVMLLTLGVQLVESGRWPKWRWLVPVVGVKLLVLPVVTGLVAWAFGMWPWPGAQLVIAAAAPTAVNIVLLNVELDADPRTAADCVFWTSLVSCVTLTVAMHLVLRFGT